MPVFVLKSGLYLCDKQHNDHGGTVEMFEKMLEVLCSHRSDMNIAVVLLASHLFVRANSVNIHIIAILLALVELLLC